VEIPLIPWILNHHKRLFAIINQAHLAEERNIVIEEVTEMRKNANYVSMNARTGIETSTDIVDMLASLWKDPNVWRVPKEIVTEWSV
jgi:arginyl-tRNA synthetase